MKKTILLLASIFLLAGCAGRNTTDIRSADVAQEKEAREDQSALAAALANWCRDASCQSSEKAIAVTGCGELAGGGKKYAFLQDVETSAPAELDVYGCLVIKERGVTLDCQGHALRYIAPVVNGKKLLTSNGIRIYESDVVIKNCLVDGFEDGIAANAWSSKKDLVNLTLENNIIVNSEQDGIYLQGIGNSIIRNNIAYKNLNGIYVVWGKSDLHIESNVACENKVSDFACLTGNRLIEGEGNFFDESRVCENNMPLSQPCQ